MGKVVTVEDVQIMRLSHRLLYSAPFDDDEDAICEYCGERAPKSPCPHCGRPSSGKYIRPTDRQP